MAFYHSQKCKTLHLFLIWFDFYKKNNETEFKKKPNRNRFKPTYFGSVRFFRIKTGLAWFFPVWIRFGFFCFRLMIPNQTG
jgi:hypothetical protein